jgi:L-threonine kinase
VALQANHLLYRDFPIWISRPYKELALAPDWSTRHLGLLGLADAAIAYMASLCLSDYRTQAHEPARSVEVMLERSRSKNLTLGRELALFRASASAIEGPLIPAPADFPACELHAVGRFVAAVDAVQVAVDGLHSEASPTAIDVGVHVTRALPEYESGLGWWGGWERLVAYRNKVAHFDSERWPIYSPGYWDIMGPLLHDGLVELLTQQGVAEAVLAHPVFQLTRICADESGNFVHSLCGEERGVYFEREVTATQPVTERWSSDHWAATEASSCVLERDREEWRIRGLFWDLRNGVPPVMDMEAADSAAKPSRKNAPVRPASSLRPSQEGRGTAPGTCGEFVQGVLSSGKPFHVTCPINKSATVVASLRSAKAFDVLGLGGHHRKLELAIQRTAELLDLGTVEVTVRHWSDLDIGKGMGSSTADVLAGVRAIANAADESLTPEVQGRLAAMVESSDGSMYPGIAAVNHKTCQLIQAWDWYPEFVIVMLVPKNSVDTASIPFVGQERLAKDYDDLFLKMDRAIQRRSIGEFAEQSTRSAVLNDEFLLNPYSRNLVSRLKEFDALGLSVGHTGTVCGLLFANTDAGRTAASEASLEVSHQFPDLKDVKVVTTPHCTFDGQGNAGTGN